MAKMTRQESFTLNLNPGQVGFGFDGGSSFNFYSIRAAELALDTPGHYLGQYADEIRAKLPKKLWPLQRVHIGLHEGWPRLEVEYPADVILVAFLTVALPLYGLLGWVLVSTF